MAVARMQPNMLGLVIASWIIAGRKSVHALVHSSSEESSGKCAGDEELGAGADLLCNYNSRKLAFITPPLLRAGISGASLIRRSFSPTPTAIPAFGVQPSISVNGALGPSGSVRDPISGITFIRDPTTGRFLPVDPITGQVMNPSPIPQQDPTTGQTFIVVGNQSVLVDPILGSPLGISTLGRTETATQTTNPVTFQFGRRAVRLPAVGYREGPLDGDFTVRLGNAVYSENPISGRSFFFGRK